MPAALHTEFAWARRATIAPDQLRESRLLRILRAGIPAGGSLGPHGRASDALSGEPRARCKRLAIRGIPHASAPPSHHPVAGLDDSSWPRPAGGRPCPGSSPGAGHAFHAAGDPGAEEYHGGSPGASRRPGARAGRGGRRGCHRCRGEGSPRAAGEHLPCRCAERCRGAPETASFRHAAPRDSVSDHAVGAGRPACSCRCVAAWHAFHRGD